MISLPKDLVTQFVKITNDKDNKNNKESLFYGTVVERGNTMYVKLDGSEYLTPMSSTVRHRDGERVTVTIKDHTAIVNGNLTSPAASSKDLDETNQKIENLEVETAKIENLETNLATINKAIVNKAEIKDLEATNANISNLKTNKADINLANVNNAWIENGTIKNGAIGEAAIRDSAITSAKIADATIEAAKIKSINADSINAGTIKTERLIITGPNGQDSIVKAINRANGISEAEVNSEKIQAASIDVVDLSAFKATLAQFTVSQNAIYSGKRTIQDPTSGVYISTTGIGIGNGTLTGKGESPIQMLADGSFRLIGRNASLDFNTVTGELDINASSFKIASKAVATTESVTQISDKLDTVKNKVDNISVGGRNLIKNSNVYVSNTNYDTAVYYLTEKLVKGETYTFQVWGNLGSGKDFLGLYIPDGSHRIGELLSESNETYAKCTFTYNTDLVANIIYLYAVPYSQVSTTTITKVKLEKGNVATDYSPAPEDSIETLTTEYYLSTSSTSLSGGTWSSVAPAWTDGKYMWSRNVVTNGAGVKTYSPSANGTCIAGATGQKGDTGTDGSKIVIAPVSYSGNDYYPSYSESAITNKINNKSTDSFQISSSNGINVGDIALCKCVTSDTKRTTYMMLKVTSISSSTVKGTIIGQTTGNNGSDGDKGDKGNDGSSLMTLITNYSYTQTQIDGYAKTTYSGTWAVTSTTGVKVGDTVLLRVTNTTKNGYSFIIAKVTAVASSQVACNSLGLLDKGETGAQGNKGDKGDKGNDGKGIKSTVITYQASNSQTTVPSGTWSSSLVVTSATAPYLWTKTVITYTDNTTSTSYNVGSTLNSLLVGGRNLLRHSGNFDTDNKYKTYWENNGGGLELDNTVTYLGKSTLKTTVGNGFCGAVYYDVDPNKTYTYSAMVKSNADLTGWSIVPMHLWVVQDRNNTGTTNKYTVLSYQQTVKANTWTLMYITFKPNGNCFRPFIWIDNSASVQLNIAYLKLEEGNKPTDWTPAPEDFNQQILDTKEEITKQVSSDFKVNNESILGTVSEKYSTKQELQLTNNKFVNYSTTTEMNAAIKAKADAIETSVSKVTETVNSLSVGGRNLFKYSQRNKYKYIGGTIEENGCETIYKCNKSGGWAIYPVSNPTSLVPANTDFVVSFDVRNTNGFGFELTATSGTSTRVQGKQEIVNNSSEWERVSYCLNTGSVTDLGGINLWGIGEVRHIKFELGNKPTDWTPAPEDTEAQITAVSTVATQTAEKFNWLVKSGTSSSNFELTDRTASLVAKQINLSGLVSFEGLDSSTRQKITDASSTASSAKQAADSASSVASSASSTASSASSTANAAKKTADSASSTASSASSVASEAKKTADSASSTASSASSTANQAKSTADSAKTIANSIPFSQGKLLFADPSFKWSSNSTMTYNNRGNGTVTVTRSAKSSDNPIADTNYELVIKNTGSANPGIGGFCWPHASRANAVFVYRIIAKIPTGRNFEFATNAIGDNHTRRWLTPHLGTGKYEEYIFKVICGSSGNFSSTGFFYIDGSDGSTSNPVTWYVAYAAVYDMTQQNEAESWVINNGTNIANWCAQNNRTLIDGAKIYTGSIAALQIASNAITAEKIATGAVTASKISVNSLEAIVAKIGGFNIGSTYLANNTTSLGGSANSVYVGTNGISCGTAFKVTNAGALTASNVDVSGKISATSGSIGGWTIASSNLYNGNWGLDNSVMLCTGSSASKSIGGSANINGWTITSGSKFGVTKNGDVYASNINATGGKIGGWTINSDSLISDTTKKYTDAHGSVLSNFASTFSDSELTFSYIEDGVERYAGLSPTGLTIEVESGVYIAPLEADALFDNFRFTITKGNKTIEMFGDSGKSTFPNINLSDDGLYIKDSLVINRSTSNNLVIGYGQFSEGKYATNLYAGTDINFYLKNPNVNWRPYYRKGDSINISWCGAGYITSSGKRVRFSIPLSKPAVGISSVSASAADGLTIRQNGKYLFGSSGSANTKAGTYTANLDVGGNSVYVSITFSDSTNVTNNDACGISANIKLTFN